MQKCIPGSEHAFQSMICYLGQTRVEYSVCRICYCHGAERQYSKDIIEARKINEMSPFERATYMIINEDKLKNVTYIEKDPV